MKLILGSNVVNLGLNIGPINKMMIQFIPYFVEDIRTNFIP